MTVRRFQSHFVDGSSLTFLKTLPANSFDAVITSPPYANRYDYTRTYALELAFLDYDKEAVSQLRQDLLTATVENKSKRHMLAEVYGPDHLYSDAVTMADGQEALQEVLAALRPMHVPSATPTSSALWSITSRNGRHSP